MVTVPAAVSPAQGAAAASSTARAPPPSGAPGDGGTSASAARKRKAGDTAGVVAAAAGTDPVGSSDIPPFLEEFREKKLEGTLAAWRNNAKERADEIKKAIRAAARKDTPTQEDAEGVFEILKKEPLGSEDNFLNLDLSEFQRRLNILDRMRKDDPGSWLANVGYWFDVVCQEPINEIYERLKEIRADLKAYAAFSNKTEMGTRTLEQEEAYAVSDSEFKNMMEGLHIPSPSKEQEALQKFLANSERIEPWWPRRTPKDDKVKRFSDFWSELVQKSKKCDMIFFRKKPAKVEPTVQAILQWDNPNNKFAKLIFPTDTAAEKEAVQPILCSLLRALSQIRDDRTGSESRSDLRRERYMPPSVAGPRRFVDFESNPLSPFTGVLLNQEMSLVKEAKNLRRKSESAEQLHGQVSKQMCGHLAKRALVAFDVGDVGVDSRSAGVIITPVYIQVISLQLEGMGTKNAKLKFDQTPLWPLVNEAAFDALVQNRQDKEYLKPQLFPGRDSSSGPDLPKGMKCLWELLHSSDADLGVLFFGAENQDATFFSEDPDGDSVSHSIGQLLGSGAQGLVYGIDDDDELVVKASVVGEIRYIKREFMALRTLAEGEGCQHIPELRSCGYIEYAIRETTASVPALLMVPKGVPALQHLSSLQNKDKSKTLLTLWSNVSDALVFAHKSGVYHLDVSPRNIVFDGSRFVLIDWGCAACANDEVVGFRGSLPYAHAAVHAITNKQRWKPKAEYDIASLMFTVCALWEDNSVPWPGFNARLGKNDQAFQHRRDQTKKKLVDLLEKYQESGGGRLWLHGMDASTVRASNFKSVIKQCIKDA